MLQEPNLDNQSFDEIMEAVLAKLPHLDTEWTDHNAHDPGVTMLELFAWYKQYQQYHLNLLTESNVRALLKLLGVRLGNTRQAVAYAAPASQAKRLLPAGMQIYSAAGERLELCKSAVVGDVLISQMYLSREDGLLDVTQLLKQQTMPVTLRQGDTVYIGLEGVERDIFSLWFSLLDTYPVARNGFDGKQDYKPREISITFPGFGAAEAGVVSDDTHMLAVEGEITLRRPREWKKTDGQMGLSQAFWLALTLKDGGCEEPLVLAGIFSTPLKVEQTQTICEQHMLLLPAGQQTSAQICSRLAAEGTMAVLARDDGGWYPVDGVNRTFEARDGCRLCVLAFPPLALQEDNLPNVRVVFSEQAYAPHVKRASSGMPGMRLPLYGKEGVPIRLALLCRTTLPDGRERYEDWQWVDTLASREEKARVFAYDPTGEHLCFGDNQNGAVPLKGGDALWIAELAMTKGKAGAPLEGDDLYFADLCAQGEDDQPHARIVKAVPGCDQERIAQAEERLGVMLRTPCRAVTTDDYAKIAMRTPGLRMMAAKALPLYNGGSGAIGQVEAVVSIVVLPYSASERPMPNAQFLAAVQAQMERHRPVCTEVVALAPIYAPLTITAEVITTGSSEQAYEQAFSALSSYFDPGGYINNVGEPLLLSSVIERIGEARDVLAVHNVSISVKGVQYSRNRRGDVILPKHAIPYLDALELRTGVESA